MVWRHDKLSPGAIPAWSCTAFQIWEGCGEERNKENSRAPVRVPLHKHGAPHIVRAATICPNSLSPPRFWRNDDWINDREEDWYSLETTYVPSHFLGSHGSPEEECCWFQLRGQGGEVKRNERHQGHMARQWCRQDLNPGLFESQVYIHFPTPLEFLIQILILCPKKEQNLKRTWKE